MFNLLIFFIGYGEHDGVKGYYLYNTVTWKKLLSRNVIFDENLVLSNVVHGSIITQPSII